AHGSSSTNVTFVDRADSSGAACTMTPPVAGVVSARSPCREHPMSRACRHRFADFVLDIHNRSLERAGVPVALNARYFDALALLVREHGQLVGKQRFFEEVWRDAVVTDAALTQC